MVMLKHVAEKCGVSISVASRALNARPDSRTCLAPETRRRVRTVARELGYKRNRAAECLRRGRSQAMGIFLPEIANRLIADLIFGLAQEAALNGFPLNLSFGMDYGQYRAFIEQSRRQPSSGIITYPFFELDPRISRLLNAFQRQGHPLVLVNPMQPVAGVPTVAMDEAEGGRLAARRLIDTGCRRLIVYGQYPGRNDGFEAEAIAAGRVVEFAPTNAGGLAAIRSARAGATAESPLGVFTVMDKYALAVLSDFRDDLAAIGREVRLIGYDDLDLTEDVTPPLTTIRQPFKQLGMLAVRRIVAALDGRPPGSDTVNPVLILRKTG